MHHPISYRPEVDGLRAVAVLSVIIFHINSSWLPGGFVGVDIFFVISGYLITSVILNDVQHKSFSFKEFYVRRIKRILPALYVVLFVSGLIAYFTMLPSDLKNFGKSMTSTLVFLSNLQFIDFVVGYWDSAEQPLIHTWSLSVEEQFYLFWPIILLLLYPRIHSRTVWLLIFGLMIVSSMWYGSYLIEQGKVRESYYLIATRAGELIIGSFLLFIKSRKYKSTASYVGLLLILYSLFFLSPESSFPGFNALFPTIGAALIIYGQSDSLVGRFLSIKPVVFIGLISYSLYLWHWPVLSFYRYIWAVEHIQFSVVIIILTVVFVLSWLSWKYVEQVFRKKETSNKNVFVWYFGVPTFLLFIMGSLLLNNNLYHRFSTDLNQVIEVDMLKEKETRAVPHTLYEGKKGKAIVFGDSHSGAFANFFTKIGEYENTRFDVLTSGNCAPSLEFMASLSSKCKLTLDTLLREAKNYDAVYIAGRYEARFDEERNGVSYLQSVSNLLSELTDKGVKVVVIKQVPKYKDEFIARRYLVRELIGVDTFDEKMELDSKVIETNNELLSLIETKHPSVYWLDLDPLICSGNRCSPFDDNSGVVWYWDDDHLNLYGSSRLADKVINSGRLLNDFLER